MELLKRQVNDLPAEEVRQDFSSAVQELNIYRYLNSARDVNEFSERIRVYIRRFGANGFWHHHLSVSSDALDTFGTFPSRFINDCARERFYRDDMMLHHFRTPNPRPYLFQSEINKYIAQAPFQNDMFALNSELAKLIEKYKLQDVCGVSIGRSENRALFGLYISNSGVEVFQQQILNNFSAVQVLAQCVDSIGAGKFKTHFHNRRANPHLPIHSRPLRLLAALQKDLTLNEAAEVCGIAVSTANAHIAAAKKAFGTYTTHGTICAALAEGLLDE